VLSVQAWVAERGMGGCLLRDTVLIESEGPRLLTRYGRL
jgi:Xaa-Pro dipeptidase